MKGGAREGGAIRHRATLAPLSRSRLPPDGLFPGLLSELAETRDSEVMESPPCHSPFFLPLSVSPFAHLSL